MAAKIFLFLILAFGIFGAAMAQGTEDKNSSKDLDFLFRYLSPGQEIVYAGRIDSATFYVISRRVGADCRDYRNYQVKIGAADRLEEVTVRDVMCNGGSSTFVMTTRGMFYFPSAFLRSKSAKAAFNSPHGHCFLEEFCYPGSKFILGVNKEG